MLDNIFLKNTSKWFKFHFSLTRPPLPPNTMLLRQVESCYYPSHLSTLYWGKRANGIPGPTNDFILKTLNE